MLCGLSSLWWPFGWNWSYLGFLGIIWRTCGSKCRGEGGGIFPTLCAECCLVKYMWFQKSISNFKKWTFFETKYETMQQSHYSAVIRRAMAPQITGSSTVYSIVCSGADRRSHQSSALLTFARGIHRWPVDSPRKGAVTRKIFPYDDFIMPFVYCRLGDALLWLFVGWVHRQLSKQPTNSYLIAWSRSAADRSKCCIISCFVPKQANCLLYIISL